MLVRLDESDPPYPFGAYSYTDIPDWRGSPDHPGYRQLLRRIASLIPPGGRPQRPPSIVNGRIRLPAFFFSTSSHETQLAPAEALNAIRVFGAPEALISAYDLVDRNHSGPLVEQVAAYRRSGGFIIVDSGNYEATRVGTRRRWKPEDLKQALATTPHDWAFCFDVLNPPSHPDHAVQKIVEAVERDRSFTPAPVLPIVHAPKTPGRAYKLEHLPMIVRDVAKLLEPPVIAVPERELGPGLIARAKTVRRIREELDQLPFYQPLHILGTGNPWSIGVLAAAGADTFDGLEWCRFVIDADSERIHHFQHFDLFVDQAARSPFVQAALDDPEVEFAGKTVFHNLAYYADFGKIMRDMFAEGAIEGFVVGLIGKRAALQLSSQFPRLFR